jgi:hypothetical protein
MVVALIVFEGLSFALYYWAVERPRRRRFPF